MFYGINHLVLALFDPENDIATLLRWLTTIGAANAALFRDLLFITRRKSHTWYAEKVLPPQLRQRDVRVDDKVVRVVRLPYPLPLCETCVMKAAGAFGRREQAMSLRA